MEEFELIMSAVTLQKWNEDSTERGYLATWEKCGYGDVRWKYHGQNREPM